MGFRDWRWCLEMVLGFEVLDRDGDRKLGWDTDEIKERELTVAPILHLPLNPPRILHDHRANELALLKSRDDSTVVAGGGDGMSEVSAPWHGFCWGGSEEER